MCGLVAILQTVAGVDGISRAAASLSHRGPDATGIYLSPSRSAMLAHTRLSILDLSADGIQPMADPSGRYHLVFNGEIYNYVELRRELEGRWQFRTRTDTEVLLASLVLDGEAALDRCLGMFAFVLWDEQERTAIAARDRFGVKPLYFHIAPNGDLIAGSEIKALHALGVPRQEDDLTWANYLAFGVYDHSASTFWKGVRTLGPGELMRWKNGQIQIRRWYDVAAAVGDQIDERPESEVAEEYLALLLNSIELRFRADVPVGINLSGGLDSSLLLGLVRKYCADVSSVLAFTFTTGDSNYDELPWVTELIRGSSQALLDCRLHPTDVPSLAHSISRVQDEPFGGLPTIAYAKLFDIARQLGVVVLLDGQGMDEQWAGYDYYRDAGKSDTRFVQGTIQSTVRPGCLEPTFLATAEKPRFPRPFADPVRNLQYRDIRYTKIPRALRFNDRVSMRASTELREPFLDHRLVELALRQPTDRKIRGTSQKDFLRQLARRCLPVSLADVPKRPLQTPQREWLRGPLRGWATELIELACTERPQWLNGTAVRDEWTAFQSGESDNSFYVWQWISVGIACRQSGERQTFTEWSDMAGNHPRALCAA